MKTKLFAFLVLAAMSGPLFAANDPLDVFKGRSHGQGQLKVIFKKPQTVDVDNVGTVQPNGDLVLVQRVDDHVSVPRTRSWRIHKVGPSRYTGTMDDAVGPVSFIATDNQVHFTYVDHDGNHFDQLLVSRGPKEIINYLKVKRFGFTVARMTETIRKLD